jgi:hypothetical protein
MLRKTTKALMSEIRPYQDQIFGKWYAEFSA